MVAWGSVELPGFDAPLVAVPTERREALAAHVRDLIADAKKRKSGGKDPEPATTDDANKIATACGLCRGFCCRTGGNEAYLNPVSIARVQRARPDLTSDGLVAAYLAAVPDQAFEGSCIFHAANGCSLPGDMRSNVCHAYLCTPLRTGLALTSAK